MNAARTHARVGLSLRRPTHRAPASFLRPRGSRSASETCSRPLLQRRLRHAQGRCPVFRSDAVKKTSEGPDKTQRGPTRPGGAEEYRTKPRASMRELRGAAKELPELRSRPGVSLDLAADRRRG